MNIHPDFPEYCHSNIHVSRGDHTFRREAGCAISDAEDGLVCEVFDELKVHLYVPIEFSDRLSEGTFSPIKYHLSIAF